MVGRYPNLFAPLGFTAAVVRELLTGQESAMQTRLDTTVREVAPRVGAA